MSEAQLEHAYQDLLAASQDMTSPAGVRDWAAKAATRLGNMLSNPPGELFYPRLGDAIDQYLVRLRNTRNQGSIPYLTLDAVVKDYEDRARLGLALTDPIPPPNGGS